MIAAEQDVLLATLTCRQIFADFPLYLKGIAGNKACTFISANRPGHNFGKMFKSPANPSI
jgi:hypothetical protein